MFFINQALTMLWEAILVNSGLASFFVILLIVAWLIWVAMGRGKAFKSSLSFILAAIIAVIGFFTLPSWVHAEFSDMNYWVDWVFHILMVIALLIYAYLVLLPLVTALTSSSKIN